MNVKQQVQDLFEPEFVASSKQQHKSSAVLYRGRMAESGSAQQEPKQSWEVKLCSCQNSDLPIANEWTRALHSVAVAVTRVLQLPPNVFVKEGDCHCTQTNDTDNCNIDLLRIFLYDAVETTDANSDSLGSSPHTDWGSWTVVWQDDVGGLQTYCHVHDEWVNVPAPPLQESRIYFVVHVGDVTSLAMGHATMKMNNNEKDNAQPVVVWPSPRHRVVSPSDSVPRVSLVYFAYPPPVVSLQDMEDALVENDDAVKNKSCGAVVVPFGEYFVLQNQSSTSASTQSPKDRYNEIRSRPLDHVFAEKWQQVQR